MVEVTKEAVIAARDSLNAFLRDITATGGRLALIGDKPVEDALRAALAAMPSEWNAAIEAAAKVIEYSYSTESVPHMISEVREYSKRLRVDAIRALRRPA